VNILELTKLQQIVFYMMDQAVQAPLIFFRM